MGSVRVDLAAQPWRGRSERLWPYARDALQSLLGENDLVVIEGAGSPAEINLYASDYVNMRTARAASAACLLVADIDRGGAFAHLYGTHQLLPPDDRALDPRLRAEPVSRRRRRCWRPARKSCSVSPACRRWRCFRCGVTTGCPKKTAWFELDDWAAGAGADQALRVAVLAFPRISNLDELQPLRRCAQVRLRVGAHAAGPGRCRLDRPARARSTPAAIWPG